VSAPHLTICVPAYNRAEELPELLDSAFAQDYPTFDVLICEDVSPQREAIRAIAQRYVQRYPGRVHYHENAQTLGYDANFRELLRRAPGAYCFIMGNDDVLAPGALRAVADVLARHPDAGVVLRAFACFDGTPDNVVSVHRYFPDEMRFEAGTDAVVAFFRRLVVMSGIVIHRESALRHETDRFDGSLFYQQHVASSVLMERAGVMTPEVLVYYRLGNAPLFGASAREQGRFTPGRFTPESDRRMVEGLLAIARQLDATHGGNLYARIRRDFGNYMYPTLAKQGAAPLPIYLRFYRDLARMGFWRYPLFHAYALGIRALGTRRLDRLIGRVRRALGHTPVLGERVTGVAVRPGASRV